MICPQCTSSDIRRSSSASWKDDLQSLWGRHAFRCRKCRHRFYALPSTQPIESDEPGLPRKVPIDKLSKKWKRRRLLRWVIASAVIFTVVSLFGLFLNYISVDHPSKPTDQDVSADQ